MIDLLTPMSDGTIALQQVDKTVKLRSGDRLERTAKAKRLLTEMGLSELANQHGTYTGKCTGEYTGFIRVRVDGKKRAEPFAADLWQLSERRLEQ